MNGRSEQVIKVLMASDISVLLIDLKKQLQMDIHTGLVSSTLSATKIAWEHIEKIINNENINNNIDSNVIKKLCRYYYGLGGEYKVASLINKKAC